MQQSVRGEREPFTAHPLKKSPQCLPEAKKKELKELKKQNAKGAGKGSSINKALRSKVKVKGDEKDKMPPPRIHPTLGKLYWTVSLAYSKAYLTYIVQLDNKQKKTLLVEVKGNDLKAR